MTHAGLFSISRLTERMLMIILLSMPWPGRAETRDSCTTDSFAGRYVGLENGYIRSQPAARLYQETWTAEGQVWGTLWLRQGKRFSATPYQGQVDIGTDCAATISRSLPTGVWNSAATLSATSRRGYTLDTTRGNTLSGTLTPQTVAACGPQTLHGVILSSQMGFSFNRGVWQPNAVIQRENHDGTGQLSGLAISSYAGKIERVDYTGTFRVSPDCWGTLVEVDSQGTPYHYQVVVRADGSGYYYLQTDPRDLTGAFLGLDP